MLASDALILVHVQNVLDNSIIQFFILRWWIVELKEETVLDLHEIVELRGREGIMKFFIFMC